jgi:hypothetical protein
MRYTTLGVLALAVALAACAEPGTGPTSQTVGTNEDGRPSSPALLAGGASPVIVAAAPIGPFPGSGSGISGEAILTRSTAGLWVDQDIDGLTPGYAYSVWWVIFDNPQGCVASTCAPSDLARPQAQGSLVNGGGFVAAGTTQSYSSHLARHDVDGAHVPMGDPSGVDNTYRAQVHVALRSHGVAEANPADQAVQTSQFNGFCHLPPDPPGVCQNVSVAVFSAPDAPGQGS